MKSAKAIAWLGVIFMTVGLANGFINGNFSKDGAALLANPWGLMSMIDLYVGFVLFSMWIVFRETNKTLIGILIVLMMIFGFLTAALYIAFNLHRSKGDWLKFFLGHRKDSVLANRVHRER